MGNTDQVADAEDCYKRLLQPGIETEYRNSSKKADLEAIEVFAENLRQYIGRS
ncbi:MAG: hypothetical protein R2769_12690 [Saprospiraceae bacterium]